MTKTLTFSQDVVTRALANDSREDTKFVEWEQPGVIILKSGYDFWRVTMWDVNKEDEHTGVCVKPVNKDVIVSMRPVVENMRIWEERKD